MFAVAVFDINSVMKVVNVVVKTSTCPGVIASTTLSCLPIQADKQERLAPSAIANPPPSNMMTLHGSFVWMSFQDKRAGDAEEWKRQLHVFRTQAFLKLDLM